VLDFSGIFGGFHLFSFINQQPVKPMQRKGKIARLPQALRAQLNRRLSENEDGATLLD
jgi:hypothetical protein